MQTVENVVIAAAGMGKRLGLGKPKALVKVLDKAICEYQLELLKDVKNVFMVVGFCEIEVMNYVKNIRPDVIFVRNPDFRHTKTLESFYLASKLIKGDAIFMDGDMVIPLAEFRKITNSCRHGETLIGVSDRISDDPVYAIIENGKLQDFSYTKKSKYEWANIVYINAELLHSGKENVFEYLRKFLPASIECFDRLEIDTPEDLRMAEEIISRNMSTK